MRPPLLLACLSLGLCACGSPPAPTSTSPLTPGSAAIRPSPAVAESVPKSAPAASSAASSSPAAAASVAQ